MKKCKEFSTKNSKEAKLDLIINALNTLRVKSKSLSKQNKEIFMTIHNGLSLEPPYPKPQFILRTPLLKSILLKNVCITVNNSTSVAKELRISLS